jgi:hypothetical protein
VCLNPFTNPFALQQPSSSHKQTRPEVKKGFFSKLLPSLPRHHHQQQQQQQKQSPKEVQKEVRQQLVQHLEQTKAQMQEQLSSKTKSTGR